MSGTKFCCFGFLLLLLSLLPFVYADLSPITLEDQDGDLVTWGIYPDIIVINGQPGDVPGGKTIDVFWDDTSLDWDGEKGKLNTTTAYSDGSFRVSFRVPESVYGNHYVWVVTGDDSVTTPLFVQPVIYSSSTSVTGGDKIDVYVYGHSSEKDIAIVFVSNSEIEDWNWVQTSQIVMADAGETNFDGVLPGLLVEPGSVEITAGSLVVYDNGEGLLEGDGRGSINYVTGKWSLEFDQEPPDEFTLDYYEFVEARDTDYLLVDAGKTDIVGTYFKQTNIPDGIQHGKYFFATLDASGVSGSLRPERPSLSVSMVHPKRNVTFDSTPIKLMVRVSMDSSAVSGVMVDFYIDGGFLGTNYTDNYGYAFYNYYPNLSGTYSWYVGAYKNGYESDISGTRSFMFDQPEPEPEPEPDPANIVYNSIIVSPASLETEEQVTIVVTLENKGEQTGTEMIVLYFNDEIIDNKTVIVSGGVIETVTFSQIVNTAGTYTAIAGNRTITFDVTEPQPEPEDPRGIPSYPIISILLGTYFGILYARLRARNII